MTAVVGSFKLNPGKRFKFDLERSVVELEASLIWELASGGEKGTTSEAPRCTSADQGLYVGIGWNFIDDRIQCHDYDMCASQCLKRVRVAHI